MSAGRGLLEPRYIPLPRRRISHVRPKRLWHPFRNRRGRDTLSRLAERDSQEALLGRVLIGRYDGTAAALSLDDGRVITDSSRHTDTLVANLRMRADAIGAFEATPSLRDRLRAAFAAYDGATVVPAPASHESADHEPMPIAA
jgi:hypothetical protein